MHLLYPQLTIQGVSEDGVNCPSLASSADYAGIGEDRVEGSGYGLLIDDDEYPLGIPGLPLPQGRPGPPGPKGDKG